MKMPFDLFNMTKQNNLLKQNLMSTRDNLRNNIIIRHKLNEAPEGTEKIGNFFRNTANFRKNKILYENKNVRLKKT